MLLLPLISVAGAKTVLTTLNKDAHSEERRVSGFTGISSSGSYDIFVKMDGTESLRLEGDAEEISNVETIVEKGILKIRYKKNIKIGWRNEKKVNVYVSAKQLNDVLMSGSGNLKVDGLIKTSSLQTKVSGSGNVYLNTNTNDLISVLSGSGSINISGTAEDATIIISGSGSFKGKDLRTKNTDVKISGSGSAKIYADSSIDAAISGSGSLSYAGNARVSQTTSGSGRISRF